MRWLIVGALEVEVRPLVWCLNDIHSLDSRTKRGTHPDCPNTELIVLRCGIGPIKAYERTKAVLPLVQPNAVINIGTCGALIDTLTIGDVCGIRSVQRECGPPEGIPVLGPYSARSLTTVDEPCWTSEKRTELADSGAEIVEMEAAGVLKAVENYDASLPIHALKIVSDQAGARPDPVIGAGRLSRPVQIARFKYRALRLSQRTLVPALLPLLASAG